MLYFVTELNQTLFVRSSAGGEVEKLAPFASDSKMVAASEVRIIVKKRW